MDLLPIPMNTYKLGFVGAGKMAESIAIGVVQSGLLPPSRISTAIHSDSSRRVAFESIGVRILPRNDDVVEDSDVIIFSVKPQVVKDVVLQLRPLLSKKKLLVSVAAGVKLIDLQEWAGHSRFIRVMPNTPSAVGEAASASEKQKSCKIYLIRQVREMKLWFNILPLLPNPPRQARLHKQGPLEAIQNLLHVLKKQQQIGASPAPPGATTSSK